MSILFKKTIQCFFKKKKKNGQLDEIERDLGAFKADVLRRRHFDSMVTMRLSENQDVAQNEAREDRIIINGLTNPIPFLFFVLTL